MTHSHRFVGIDVGKYDCVVAFSHSSSLLKIENTPKGHAILIKTCHDLKGSVLIALEATGGYEAALWKALQKAGLNVRQVPPAQVRAYARSKSAKAKTDPIDARLICRFIEDNPAAGRERPSDKLCHLKALSAKRAQLIKARAALKCQMKQQGTASLYEMDAAHIAFLDQQITKLERWIEEAVEASEALQEKQEILRSIPGIGPVASQVLMAYLPELGEANGKQIASLVGIAPMARDSGRFKGKRFIAGGRKEVRDVLFQAAIVAAWHNSALKPFYRRLKERGKPHKVCVIAVARKLLTIANAMVAKKQKWQTA